MSDQGNTVVTPPAKTDDFLFWLRGLRTALKNADLLGAAEKLNNAIGPAEEGDVGGIAKVIGDWNGQCQLDLGEVATSLKAVLKSDINAVAKLNDATIPIVVPAGQEIKFDLALDGSPIIIGIVLGGILAVYLAE